MKYDGTYACGHTGTIDVFGKNDYREWKIKNEFSGFCPECRKEKLEKERAEALEKAKKQAEEMKLPQLLGTEKQVAWAERIRADFVAYAENQLEKAVEIAADMKEKNPKEPQKYDNQVAIIEKAFEEVLNNPNAKFWIENREKRAFYNAVKEVHERLVDTLDSENEPEEIKKENEDIKKKLTVKPVKVVESGIVEFKQTDNSISAYFVKNDKFMKLAKECRYKWSGAAWTHRINEYTGLATDREAELGNLLLQNGFTVCFSNEESKEKAINGIVEPEPLRWIKWNTELNRFSLSWERNDSIYLAAKKITSAKWDGIMTVAIDFYVEVLDFAQAYGFKISHRANEEICKFKEKMENIYAVTPAYIEKPLEVSAEEKLKEQLEKNGVIEDLLDD